jgi:nicotinamidase-related amidase
MEDNSMMATIDPRDSCFLVVEPSRLHSRLLGKPDEATTATKFELLDNAADLAKVPRWFAVYGQSQKEAWLSTPCSRKRNRIFVCDNTKMPWHNRDLVEAIKSEGRGRLILCGFWLDSGLGATALEALSDGLNVHVITDLTFSRDPAGRDEASRRLEQYGIVPVRLSQVVYELMSWTEDGETVSGLKQILEHPVFR